MNKQKLVESHETLAQVIRGLQSQGKKVVLANGCFDLLHVGHVRFLEDARRRGDFLVVAINSDRAVRRIKGKGHPINPAHERAEVVSALGCVDYVTLFDDERADSLLLKLKPDIHSKGRDYTERSVPEKEAVLSYGGSIVIAGDPKDHSTRKLLQKIRKRKFD